MDTPFFSILVPTYNQSQYLKEALDSLIFQTDLDWEAIIVNDGSTDNTPQILEEYAHKETRFKVFHKSNGGVGSALNMALENSSGQWICWLSSDDVFELNKLAIHRQWINQYPKHKFFFSNFRQLVGTSGKVVNFNPNLSKNIPSIKLQVLEMFNRNYIAGNSICILKEAWLDVGKFNEDLRYAQDYDMWFRVMIHYPALYIPEYTYLQRIYPDQESNKFRDYCFFDSARASIDILNQYKFEYLFPSLTKDLIENNKVSLMILFKALFNLDAFTYKMGFHPLLLFRFIEWISSIGTNNQKHNIQSCIINQINSQLESNYSTLLGFWYEIAQLILYHNYQFNYSTLEPQQIAQNHHSFLNDIDPILPLESLRDYSSKFLNINLSTSSLQIILERLFDNALTYIEDDYLKNKYEYLYLKHIKNKALKNDIFMLNKLSFPIKKIYIVFVARNSKLEAIVYIFLILVERSFRYGVEGIFFQKLSWFLQNLL